MDTYRTMIEREAVRPRIHPGTQSGRADGTPVIWSPETLAEKRRDMGPYTFSCQILLDPMAEETQGFKQEWLRFWPAEHYEGMNIYIVGGPASKKKKTSDYRAFIVVGLGLDYNYYIIEMVRDRLNLKQRGDELFRLHRIYEPVAVGYEEYGLQADIEYFQERMDRKNYRFDITPLGGPVAKEDRIKGLVPDFEQHRIYLPQRCLRTNWEGHFEDLTRVFVNEEYNVFPYISHDDMLDCLSRIKDPELETGFPMFQSVPDIAFLQGQDEQANILDPFA
jgi:phage terminase large subunit-like protein